MNFWQIFKLASLSYAKSPIVAGKYLRHRKDRLGVPYDLEGRGKYVAFRETVSSKEWAGEPTVLVIGFRLKLIGRNRAFHWLFQRVCLLTTPFWCGLDGFKIKMWMVEPKTKDYAGVYLWRGEENTKNYVAFLVPILKFFSVKDSIWWKIHPRRTVDQYLAAAES